MTTSSTAINPDVECTASQPIPASPVQFEKRRSRTQRVIRHIKRLVSDSGQPDSGAQASHSTFDLVAGLFCVVLREERISPLTRLWFAQLQFPVLREALTDPMAFQVETHPARRLLAHIGDCARELCGCPLLGDVMEREIERLVHSIEMHPTAHKAVFEQADHEFGQFLASFKDRQALSPAGNCEACQNAQKDALITQYRTVIRERLNSQPIQASIRDFLDRVWVEVLTTNAVCKGPEHAETLDIENTALDLIQLNTALHRRKDRSRAIRKVPHLVKKLRHGMTLIGLSADEQDHHIKAIGANLTEAFLSEPQDATLGTAKTERRSSRRLLKSSGLLASQKVKVDGLHVIDDDDGHGSSMAWRLWERAVIEQELNSDVSRADVAVGASESVQDTQVMPLDYWMAQPGGD